MTALAHVGDARVEATDLDRLLDHRPGRRAELRLDLGLGDPVVAGDGLVHDPDLDRGRAAASGDEIDQRLGRHGVVGEHEGRLLPRHAVHGLGRRHRVAARRRGRLEELAPGRVVVVRDELHRVGQGLRELPGRDVLGLVVEEVRGHRRRRDLRQRILRGKLARLRGELAGGGPALPHGPTASAGEEGDRDRKRRREERLAHDRAAVRAYPEPRCQSGGRGASPRRP